MTITLPPVPRPEPRRAVPFAKRRRTYAPSGDVGHHLARARALQLQIQELTAHYDTERAWLQAHMQQRDLSQVSLGDIRCLLKQRSNWTYSPETEREMQALRVTQGWEQKQGIATNTPSFYVALSTKPSTPAQ